MARLEPQPPSRPTREQASIEEVLALWRRGEQHEAEQLCATLLAAAEGRDALSLFAEISSARGKLTQAVASLRRLSELEPHDAAVSRRLGDALFARGSLEEAERCYRRATELEPANARGHNNLGQTLLRLGRAPEALASLDRAVALDSGYAIAHHNYGVAQLALGAHERAIACFGRALEIDPRRAATWRCQGDALQRLGRWPAALESYEHALAREAGCAETLSNCANVLLELGRAEEALDCCERALALKPDLTEAHSNRGGALRRLNRYAEATAACERALQLRPDFAIACNNLADLALVTGRVRDALDYCERALALDPRCVKTHELRARALLEERRPEEAAASYEEVLASEPQRKFARGAALHARLMCCDWQRYERGRAELITRVASDEAAVDSFTFLSICDSPELQLRCARRTVEAELPGLRAAPLPVRYRHERIRIAYLSADFHQHATGLLAAGLFERHERRNFEITAVSFGPEDGSAMRQRLRSAFDLFLDVRCESDAQVIERLRALEIDIAVDLKGFTAAARPGILARRAAPIQVSWLGHPGTLGIGEIDYLIADRTVLPPEERIHYSEQIVYLPDSYQVNDDRRGLPVLASDRAAAGLPERAVVFGCFNQPYKITPEVFDLWMRLLREVPGSVLWLLAHNGAAMRNLVREAVARGVAAERLVFAPHRSPQEHLARHLLADLFLDTLPYNAHTTASDALWAGVPLLTCVGRSFAGRVGASLLNAAGVPELITRDLDEYFARALGLASQPHLLGGLRARLTANRAHCALFDTERFCRHLEDAYSCMWQRHQQGLAPESFAVTPRLSHERHPSRKRHPLPAS